MAQSSVRPPGVSEAVFKDALKAFAAIVGPEWVLVSEADRHSYLDAFGRLMATLAAKRLDKDHALLENRTDLPAPAIRAIVRSGVGSMPPMRRTELSDSDLEAIAAYLTRHEGR